MKFKYGKVIVRVKTKEELDIALNKLKNRINKKDK